MFYANKVWWGILQRSKRTRRLVTRVMGSAARVSRSKVWAARGRAEVPGRAPLEIAHGVPTFIGDDLEASRKAARANLALFTTFPFYQRMFRAAALPKRRQRRSRVPAATR